MHICIYNRQSTFGQQKLIYNTKRLPKIMTEQSNDKQINHQQKYFVCNQCLFWIYQIIVIVLVLLILGNFINTYNTSKIVLTSTHYQHSLQTVWLWKQGYIIDIKAEKTNNCPQGYEPLITYNWPGSLRGCSCSSTSNGYSFSYVLQGQCNSQLISLGCNVVNAMSNQTLNMWKGSTLLCYKRAPSMNFYNSVVSTAPSGGSSPNMTVCAFNQSYQVYTLPGVSCPITAGSNSSLGSAQSTLSIDSNFGYNFNFINQTGYPIAGFKTTEYSFCDFFNASNISPNKQGTYILQITNVTNCPLKDSRMVQVDYINEYDFYTNNTRVYQMIESLPAYPQPSSDYNYILGYIPYPTWTFQCRNDTDYNLYQATDRILFKNPSNSLSVSLSIILPCILLYLVVFRLFYIIRHIVDLKSRKTYNALMLTQQQIIQQMPNLDIKKSFKRQCCIFVLQTLTILGVAAALVYSIVILTNQSVWIKVITRLQCTDSYLQNIFYYYEQNIDQMASNLIQCTFFLGFLLITHLCYFIARNSIGDLFFKTVVVEEQKIESIDQQKLVILDKEGALQGYNNVQDSSEIIIQKEDTSDLKVFDIDYLMGADGGAQTKQNFYNSISLDREVSPTVAKKKKKKRPLNVNKKKKDGL